MGRASVHISRGGAGGEYDHVTVELSGTWVATARQLPPDSAAVSVQRGNGPAHVVPAWWRSGRWRMDAELNELPVSSTAKQLARRALARLPGF